MRRLSWIAGQRTRPVLRSIGHRVTYCPIVIGQQSAMLALKKDARGRRHNGVTPPDARSPLDRSVKQAM